MTAVAAASAVPRWITADLKNLTEQERATYYQQVCDSLGLNPLTKPFEFMTMNGKLVLYAKKDCTEQLRKIHKVSITQLLGPVIDEGIVVFTAHAKDADGRTDVGTGAASIDGKKGEDRANAIMRAETKAKRRVTLSLCGLGMLDETELEPETAVFTTPIESQPAPEPTSFHPVSTAPATEHGEHNEAREPRPSSEQVAEFKGRVSKFRAVLEDAGFQPSPGATTGTKLVRFITKCAGAPPKDMTVTQWNAVLQVLDRMLETNVKDAVKRIEEAIAA